MQRGEIVRLVGAERERHGAILRSLTPKKGRGAPTRSVRPKSLTNQFTLKLYDNRLHLGVIRQSIFTAFAPNSGLLVAAERRSRVEHVVAIHPHGARAHAVRDGMRLGDVLGPDRRRESIHALVGALHD